MTIDTNNNAYSDCECATNNAYCIVNASAITPICNLNASTTLIRMDNG